MPRLFSLSAVTLSVLLTASAIAVSGCGTDIVAAGSLDGVVSAGISGSVHGGSQPISGATITLYAPATNGYGNAPKAIVSTTTSSSGGFTLPTPFTCPANSGNVYVLATGGDPGAFSENGSIALATLLGPCSSLNASTKISINEATTVAAAFALAQFATVSSSGTGIGTSATNLIGLNNAYQTASKLVNPATGLTNGATALNGIVLPTAEVNTLANILGYCVNSDGSTCAALFAAATPPNGSAPKDTFQAAIDIALNPTNGLTPLFDLSSSYTPFQPGLSNQPADFALGIQYNGSVISTCAFTNGVAIDQSGNAWVGCGTGNSAAGITEISPAGAYLSPASGFALPTAMGATGGNGIAIDANGAAWVTSAAENAVYQITSSGAANRFYLPASLNGPTGIAINNGTSQVYVANTGNDPAANNGSTDNLGSTIAILTLSGSLVSANGATLAYGPTDLVNANGNYVFADFTSNTTASPAIPELVTYAPGQTGTIYPYGGTSDNGDLAADAANNIWYINEGAIMQFGAESSGSTYNYTPTGVDLIPSINPISILFDGNDRLLIAGSNSTSSTAPGQLAYYDDNQNLLYTLIANNTIPSVPYDPTGLDIDASGNVWISGSPASGTGFVTELVGAAAPLPMPRSAAGLLSEVGARP